jgi:hypothetical protein
LLRNISQELMLIRQIPIILLGFSKHMNWSRPARQ